MYCPHALLDTVWCTCGLVRQLSTTISTLQTNTDLSSAATLHASYLAAALPGLSIKPDPSARLLSLHSSCILARPCTRMCLTPPGLLCRSLLTSRSHVHAKAPPSYPVLTLIETPACLPLLACPSVSPSTSMSLSCSTLLSLASMGAGSSNCSDLECHTCQGSTCNHLGQVAFKLATLAAGQCYKIH